MEHVLADLQKARAAHKATFPSRPFVLLTWAQSVDGYISTSCSAQTHISGRESAEMTHALRAESDAILVGVQTVFADNPRLNTRLSGHPPDPRPAAVVLDSKVRTPCDANLIASRRGCGVDVLIYHGEEVMLAPINDLPDISKERHVKLVSAAVGKDGRPCISNVVTDLHRRGYEALMVEGGSRVLSSFIKVALCDFVIVTIAPLFLGCGVVGISCEKTLEGVPIALPPLAKPKWRQIGNDMILSGRVLS